MALATLLTIVSAALVGCRDTIVDPISSSVLPQYVVADGRKVTLRDVPELTMNLPEFPRSWDDSDSALVGAMVESRHRAFVGLKNPGKAHVQQTSRLEVQEVWRPDLIVRKGTRAAIDGNSLRAGLELIEARGGRVLQYYDATGMALIEIEPALAPGLRAHTLVDYVEPALAKYETASAAVPTGPWTTAASTMFFQTTPWGVDAVRAPQAWSLSTGTGARLLIIDTGHQQDHEDLVGVASGNCFGNQGGCDETGDYHHGTWVSGVVIARNNSVGVVGVASRFEQQ